MNHVDWSIYRERQMGKDRIEQRWDGTMGQTAISCTDRKRPGSLPELRLTQSAHHFMYVSLGHGHLSPEHDTSQYTLHHTSSPAPNCLHE
jgi:hypothetical protein